MNLPSWTKPGLLGVGVGAVAVAIIGFSWGGWVTGGTATAMAAEKARQDVVTTLVPFCLDRSQADPQETKWMADLKKASAYQRTGILMEAGWATMPGMDEPDRDLAKACAETLSAKF